MPTESSGDICKRAYEIWESEGRPHGRDMDHWLRAEAEFQGGSGASAKPSHRNAIRKSTKARARGMQK